MLVSLSRQAHRDLADIYDHVQVDSSQAGAAWFRGLTQHLASLAAAPQQGVPLPDRPDRRRVFYGSGRNVYLIAYRIVPSQNLILISAITHGRRLKAQQFQ